MGNRVWRTCVVVVAVLGAWGALGAASALASSVANLNVSLDGTTAGHATTYTFDFNATSGITNGTSFTIDAPAGTVFPTGAIFLLDNGGFGSECAAQHVQRSNNNATLTFQNLSSNGCNEGNGGAYEILIIGGESNPLFGPGVTNPTTAGPTHLTLSTSSDSTPAQSNTYTITPDSPASVSIDSGDGQSAKAAVQFANPVVAKVSDQYGNGVPGQTVTFDSPDSGASGTFADDTVDTGSDGKASATVTANNTAGGWQGSASATGILTPATFNLTNDPQDAHDVVLGLAPGTIEANGYATSTATATVTDVFGNPVPGDSVSIFGTVDPPTTLSFGSTVDNGDGTYTSTITAPSSATGSDQDVTTFDPDTTFNVFDTKTLHLTGDSTGPHVVLDSVPSGTISVTQPEFDFHSADPAAVFTCTIDASAGGCSSPFTPSAALAEGHHTWAINAVDGLQNVGPPRTGAFTVDAVTPTLKVKGPNRTTDHTPTFTFVTNEADVKFRCQLDAAAHFSKCDTPYTTKALKKGAHTLTVKATDQAGNAVTTPKDFNVLAATP